MFDVTRYGRRTQRICCTWACQVCSKVLVRQAHLWSPKKGMTSVGQAAMSPVTRGEQVWAAAETGGRGCERWACCCHRKGVSCPRCSTVQSAAGLQGHYAGLLRCPEDQPLAWA